MDVCMLAKRIGRCLLVLIFVLISFRLAAQEQFTVSGVVTDEKGAPMVGVTVLVKNTNIGRITGLKGEYKITVPKHAVLVFSYMGYSTEEKLVGTQTRIDVVLKEESQKINDVVVTALGIKREQKALGYATTQINGDRISEALSNNWTSALSGKIAGLNLVRSDAGPSGSNKIILRGESNLTGDNQALIVIDGVVINNSSGLATGSGNDAYLGEDSPVDFGSALNDINPEDIESINVLKGAGAAALYGQRGAHGAIIITTKSGESSTQGVKVSFSSTANFETPYHWPDYQYEYGSGKEGVNYFSWGNTEDGPNTRSASVAWGPKFDGQMFYQYDPVTHGQSKERTLWQPYPNNHKDFFRTGQTYTNSISLSGGSSNTNFRLGYTNVYNEWIVPNTGYTRNTVSVSVNHKLSEKIRLSTKVNYTNKNSDNLPATGYNNQTVMYWNIMQVPNGNLDWLKDYWMPGKEGVEQSYPFSSSPDNPYLIVNEMLNKLDRHTVTGNVQMNYNIIKGLSLMLRGSMDMSYEDRSEQRPMDTNKFKYGMYRTTKIFAQELTGDFLLKYEKKISAFDLSASLGGSTLHNRYRRENNRADALMYPQVFSLSNSKFQVLTLPYQSDYVINSIYGMLTFSYNNYLFLDLTARNDWSSVLATPQSTDNSSFFYPSVNLSAVLSDMFRMPRWITFAKLRASFSEVGSSGTKVYQNTYVYSIADGYAGGLMNPKTLPNPDLKPQRTRTWEIGADVRFLNNRLGFDIALYQGTTKDQILTATLDRSSGYDNKVVNGGVVRNRGLEIEANATPIRNRNGWTWSLFGTFSMNENKVLELTDDLFALRLQNTLSGRGAMEARVGQSMSAIYGTGYMRAPDGQIVYGEDGYPLLNTDLIYLGDSTPKGKFSMGTELKYKGFNFSILFDGQFGGKGYSQTTAILMEQGKLKRTLPGRYNGIIGDGVIQNPDGSYRKNDVVATEIWTYYTRHYGRENIEGNIYSTDFLKLREITLGYTFPTKISKKLGLQKLSIGIYGRDLFMITNWPAFDPEFGTLNNGSIDKGFEIAQFPATRNFGVKLNIEF
ncbi:SusC/RagA family TonB-linked outer membrane protein [Alistipes sp. An66]|nr:SusC/RagA family TonB-linked outer membrane protein [Alistipes sp. An66]